MDKALSLQEVVESILQHLPMKDLLNTARVCKMWSEVVSRLKVNRQQLSWLLLKKNDPCALSEQIVNCMELNSSKPTTALLFHTNNMHVRTNLRDDSGQTSAEPAPKECSEELCHYLSRMLPKACKMNNIIVNGIVGTSCSGKIEELENSHAASCLLLPDMSGVDVYSFIYSGDDRVLETSSDSEEEVNTPPIQFDVPTITGLPEGTPVKLILWFVSSNCYSYSSRELGMRLVQHYKGCVLAGADTDMCNMIPDPKIEDPVNAIGIAFCGEGVQVASVYIPSDVKKEADTLKCLQKLKNCNMNEKKSVGFMVACVGRGKHFYRGKKNFESSLFSKLFPNTPLFGLFGNGEIGYDYLPDYSQTFNSSNLEPTVSSMVDMQHSYSSIFVLLCFP